MKKYSGVKPLTDILFHCKRKGWKVDKKKYDTGSDWVTIYHVYGGVERAVVFCPFNGKFIVREGEEIITESSAEMDGTPWYDDLLGWLYVEDEAA